MESSQQSFSPKVAQKNMHPAITLSVISLILLSIVGAMYLNTSRITKPTEVNAILTPTQVYPDITEVPTYESQAVTYWKESCKKIISDPNTKYKECEAGYGGTEVNLDKACSEIGGTFTSCASPCRHAPKDSVCISVCVPLCVFK